MRYKEVCDACHEDINDEFEKRGWKMTDKFQMGKSAWQNSGEGMCCGEDLEEPEAEELVEASAEDLVKAIKRPAKKKGMTLNRNAGNVEMNVAHFNHVMGADGGSQPVDPGAMADGMGFGGGEAAGGDGGCCGGESLEKEAGKAMNESYQEKFNKIISFYKQELDKYEIKNYSYNDYFVQSDWAGGGMCFTLQFDSNDPSIVNNMVRDFNNKFYGINARAVTSRGWDYAIFISVDEKACNESKEEVVDNSDMLKEGFYYTLYRDQENGKIKEYTSPCYDTREECEACAKEDIRSFNDYDGEEPIKLSYQISECEKEDSEKEEESLEESYIDDSNELGNLVKDLNRFLIEQDFFDAEAYVATDFVPEKQNVIAADITWGDWKHEHLRFKYLVNEFMDQRNLTCEITDDVTEEDGSDTYSAHYTIYNIEHIEEPEIVDESLNESVITGTLRENLERLDAESDNKYDLVQFYDSLSLIWDSIKKKEVYDMLYGKNAVEDIYKYLKKEFEEVV